MRRSKRKAFGLLLASAVTIFSLAGCSSEPKIPEKSAETSTTVTVGDAKIVVGVTLLQDLQQQGFGIYYDKQLKETIPQDDVMPGRTYDVGIYFSKDDLLYGSIQCLNDKEEEIPYIESIINKIEVYYSESKSPYDPANYTESVLVDGEDFKGKTSEQVLEAVKDTVEEEPTIINFPDETVAFISFSRNNCYFSIGFDMDTHLTSTLSVEMFHSKF